MVAVSGIPCIRFFYYTADNNDFRPQPATMAIYRRFYTLVLVIISKHVSIFSKRQYNHCTACYGPSHRCSFISLLSQALSFPCTASDCCCVDDMVILNWQRDYFACSRHADTRNIYVYGKNDKQQDKP